ncbi:MAG: 16S rRNA (guanine(527)-N(7))-methyltransferase RsmG [Chloroflexota bacterium]
MTGKTETPPERHFPLPVSDDFAAASTLDALDRLLADAPAIAATLPPAFAGDARRYVALLLAANRVQNLTRVTDPDEIARLHLLDSLAALPIIDAGAARSVVDLGSGGGLPAIPLAIARPDMRWTLVETVGRKAAALADFAAALGLGNVAVVAERAETLGRDPRHREQYEMVTARACAPLPVLAELALPLAAIGGSLLAWKGPLTEQDDEVRRGRVAIGQVGGGSPRILATELPALGGHCFVTVVKERPTAPRFPRRPGDPARRPLG